MPDALQIIAEWRAQEPACWTLARQLGQRETTTSGYLWFSDPKNCSWTPLYTRDPAALDALDALEAEVERLMAEVATERDVGKAMARRAADAVAEVERLRRQKSEARHSLEIERAAASMLVDAVERLTRERDEARADAERLAFVYSGSRTESGALVAIELRLLSGEVPTIEEVRAAIDAAKEQSNG